MTKAQLAITKSRFISVCRAHFYFVLLFAVQIMIYDAWKLITPESVLQRWLVSAGLLVSTAAVWYLARTPSNDAGRFKRLVFALVLVDVVAISIFVYLSRGMASRAVALYAIPIITAGVLQSRTALYTAAFLSIAAYSSAAVAYFVLNFNEGYKIELYGEVGFYAVAMILLASLSWAVINPDKSD